MTGATAAWLLAATAGAQALPGWVRTALLAGGVLVAAVIAVVILVVVRTVRRLYEEDREDR